MHNLYTNSVWKKVQIQAKLHPDKVALVESSGKTILFNDFILQVDSFAQYLKNIGVKKDDTVLFLERPTIRGISIFFALYRVGAVVVIADPAMGSENFMGRVKYAQTKWVALDPNLNLIRKIPSAIILLRKLGIELPDIPGDISLPILSPRIPNILTNTPVTEENDVPNDTDALIIFTSGTTSVPKGVVHSFRSLSTMLDLICNEIKTDTTSVFYSSQLHFILISLLTGSTAIIETKSKFTSTHFLRVLKRRKPTHIFLLPKEGEEIVTTINTTKNKMLPDFIKIVMFGSAPVLSGFLQRFQKIISDNTKVFGIYGLTELLPVAITSLEDKIAYNGDGDYLGKLIETITVNIDNNEIVLHGDHLCHRYLYDKPLEELRTGDLGFLTDSNELVLTGRRKDMIIRGNHNIYPLIFENTISKIPGVGACAMVGVYDFTVQDEKIFLFLENRSGKDSDSFSAFVKNELNGGVYSIDTYALPDRIVVMELPVSGRSRKINKQTLKDVASTNT